MAWQAITFELDGGRAEAMAGEVARAYGAAFEVSRAAAEAGWVLLEGRRR